MPRYFPCAGYDWIEEGATAREILIEDDEPKFSGLYDSEGRKLYRASDRIPVGFKVAPERS